MAKPSVKTKCVANNYAAKNSRIVEFSGENDGGLIAFHNLDSGKIRVVVYRCDPGVEVFAPIVGELTDALNGLRAAIRTMPGIDPFAFGNVATADSVAEIALAKAGCEEGAGWLAPSMTPKREG